MTSIFIDTVNKVHILSMYKVLCKLKIVKALHSLLPFIGCLL